MSRYKAYPEYKDSDVEWLGEVPKCWNVQKVAWRFFAKKGANAAQLTKEFCASIAGEHPVFSGQTENSGVMACIDSYEFDAGEEGYLFSTTVGEKAMTVMHIAGKFSLSQNCMVIIPYTESSIPRFYYYHFQPLFSHERGLIPEHMQASFRMEDLYQYKVIEPPKSEQATIAAFLDHETAKIDALIEKQQRLIELLKEKRQAVISHAVTKGLNPNAPMKDSGVEWLGELPAQWVVKKFSHCTIIRSGQVDPAKLPYSGFTLIAPNHIESGTGKIIGLETAEAQGADSGKYLCSEGEVIYSKIRPNLAKVCLSPSDETICSADMYPISGINGLSNKFLYWSLLSNWFTSFVTLESDRVAMPKINREKLAEIFLPIPPENEQAELVVWLKNKTDIVDALLEKAKLGIELLQERRTALISAAVTGKIDVRDWQAVA